MCDHIPGASRLPSALTCCDRSPRSSIGQNVVRIVEELVSIDHRFCPPLGLPPGGMRIPMPPATDPVGLILAASTRLFVKLIAGRTQSPQLHCMPCHAYLPTLARHFGHSRRPSSLPCSSSGRIQDSASRKKCPQAGEVFDDFSPDESRSGSCEIKYCEVAKGRLKAHSVSNRS